MEFRELSVEGAWECTPRQFADPRGVFLEWHKDAPFASAIGHSLALAQGNLSVSGAGVIRGIHFADVPPGQAKYVTCVKGAVMDVVVDIRTGSPTFGLWEAVRLDDVDRRAVYVSEGLGHAFMALTEGATVMYLCSTPYAPQREHAIDPLDPDIGIAWPTGGSGSERLAAQLSDKDAQAPSLAAAAAAGILPAWERVLAYRESLEDDSR